MITEDYVSFELAQLLKIKGFNEDCRDSYDWGGNFHLNASSNNGSIKKMAAPTLQLAMKWLREKYSIYISIQPDFPSDKDYKMCWCWSANILYENCISTKWYQCYIETYEEAAEAAIKYCLENLI